MISYKQYRSCRSCLFFDKLSDNCTRPSGDCLGQRGRIPFHPCAGCPYAVDSACVGSCHRMLLEMVQPKAPQELYIPSDPIAIARFGPDGEQASASGTQKGAIAHEL